MSAESPASAPARAALGTRELLGAAIPYVGSGVLLKASLFALGMWAARSLPAEEYAAWGLALALQTGLVTFGTVGIYEVVVGRLRKAPSALRPAVSVAAHRAFLITCGLCLVPMSVLGLAIVGAGAFSYAALAGILVSGIVLAHATLRSNLVRLDERHAASLVFQFAVPFSGLLGGGLLFLLRPSVDAFFLGSAGGLLLALAAFSERRAGIDADIAFERNDILRRLGPFVAVAFFGWMSGYGINLVVGALFPREEVARLTFVLSIGALLQLVATSMNQVWSPRFFRTTQTTRFDEVEAGSRRFFLYQNTILGVFAFTCLLLLPPALRWLGGNLQSYSATTLPLFLVLCGYLVLSPMWHAQNYFLAYGRRRDYMVGIVGSGVVGLAVWIGLMLALGPIGIYAGFLGQMAIRSVSLVAIARRTWPIRVGLESVFLGLLIGLAGFLLAEPGQWS